MKTLNEIANEGLRAQSQNERHAQGYGGKMTISELTNLIHTNAIEKGFWQKPETEREKILHEATAISLIGSEVMEALEAHRCGDVVNLCEELADVVIRTLDLCCHMNINIETEIIAKMEKNRNRPPMHGKRY